MTSESVAWGCPKCGPIPALYIKYVWMTVSIASGSPSPTPFPSNFSQYDEAVCPRCSYAGDVKDFEAENT